MIEETEKPDEGMDAFGNYANDGDLYQANESLASLVSRITGHLKSTFPEYGFSPQRSSFAGGRSIQINVISGPEGLGDGKVREAFTAKVLREMKRFEKSQGNVFSDWHSSNYSPHVKVDARYYAQHSSAPADQKVEKKMSLAEFKRTLKPRDRIILRDTTNEYSKKFLGIEREISEVRSGDFIIGTGQEKSYFNFPKSAAFACDGERFCVSDASENNPDAYRLYQWIRS